MARGKKHSPEQIVSLLRQIEVTVASGKTTAQAIPVCLTLAGMENAGQASFLPEFISCYRENGLKIIMTD